MQSRRDELRKEHQPIANDWLDCPKCLDLNTQVNRRTMHCGHLPRRLWRDPGFLCPASWPRREGNSVCPGYLVRLPQVCEVADAYQWWDRGELSHWLDYQPISTTLKAAIGILKASISDAEAEMLSPKE